MANLSTLMRVEERR